ncbi:hypothetical protein [Klebsiella pasteurii]|uniref:hypothetical protein n=1 Tax=Klebsiella pasteurii TaxID=2587529 RepID=UPI00298B16CC|nr:hypothetical protein [Klebsiella pneumoniae]
MKRIVTALLAITVFSAHAEQSQQASAMRYASCKYSSETAKNEPTDDIVIDFGDRFSIAYGGNESIPLNSHRIIQKGPLAGRSDVSKKAIYTRGVSEEDSNEMQFGMYIMEKGVTYILSCDRSKAYPVAAKPFEPAA